MTDTSQRKPKHPNATVKNHPELTTKPIVVGFTGFKGHGKDTAAQVLVRDYGFTRLGFADALKKCVAAAFGIDEAILHDPVAKEQPFPPYPDWLTREVLQYVGTELFRETWPTIWVDTVANVIARDNLQRVVITDMRFHNEVASLDRFDSLKIRVTDPRKLPLREGDSTALHASERDIPVLNVDFDIRNDEGIPELHQDVTGILLHRYPHLISERRQP